MKTNVVLFERSLRLGLGMLLLASPLLEIHSYPFNLLGIVLVVTGAIGFCPLYGLFSALLPKATQPTGPRLVPRVDHEDLQAHPRSH